MAEVFRGTMTGIGGFQREVAVKILHEHVAADEQFVKMLLDEARIAGSITHSNVVQMLDVGRHEDGRFFVVMEFVDGGDLRGLMRLAPGGRLPLDHALYIAMETAHGLSAVHASAQRIVHRDVSPTNVLLSRAGEVKLADFGVARAAHRLAHTRVGSIKGKLRYIAPEQLSGQPIDARVDLYALGVVLCESLVGPPLWEGPEDVLPGPKLLARAGRVLPEDVRDVLSRALAKNPEDRFESAQAFRRALAELLHRRQPGYNSAQLVAFMADPGALPTIIGRLDSPPPVAPAADDFRARVMRIVHRVHAELSRLSPRALALVGASAALVMSAFILLLIALVHRNVSEAATRVPQAAPAATAAKTAPLGRLAVYAKPGALVRVAGQARRAPAMFSLPAGRHRVEIGRRIVRYVDVRPDETSELTTR